MTRNTACPTVVRAGEKTNLIPQTAAAEVDCRIIPGETLESLVSQPGAALGEPLDQSPVGRGRRDGLLGPARTIPGGYHQGKPLRRSVRRGPKASEAATGKPVYGPFYVLRPLDLEGDPRARRR